MRWKIRRSVSIAIKLASFAGFAFSAACTFLGAAPSGIIKSALGPTVVGHLLHFREGVLNMTSEEAKWLLVFQGDLFFGVSLFLLFYVYLAGRLAKMYVTQGELVDMLDRVRAQLADKSGEVNNRMDAQESKMDSTNDPPERFMARLIKCCKRYEKQRAGALSDFAATIPAIFP